MIDHELPTEAQIAFAQHLLALARRLPPRQLLCMTAGELRRLLQDLPGCPPAAPCAASGNAEYSRPVAAAADQHSPPASRQIACHRLPNGEAERRIKRLLADGQPRRAWAIATACDVGYGTVMNVLARQASFQRDPLDGRLWRLRSIASLPLPPRQETAQEAEHARSVPQG